MRRRDVLPAALALIMAWQIVSWFVNSPLLPGPFVVAATFVKELRGELAIHFLISLWRVLASIALAVLLAVPAGIALGQSKILDRTFAPVIYMLYPIPKVVLVPIVLLLFGIGEFPKIFIIFIILFFQILVLVRDSAASIEPRTLLSVRSLGAGRRALYRYVYFPSSLSAILTALRQSVGTAVAVLYIAELFATESGLGYYISLNGSTLFNYPAMYAGVLAMSLLGFGLYFSVDKLEHRVCPWKFVG